MSMALSFKAQALDANSPDHLAVGDRTLAPAEEVARRGITRAITQIALSGKACFRSADVEVMRYRRQFLVQVACEQRDVRGRGTAIVCCGAMARGIDGATAGAQVAQALGVFATSIGRSVPSAHLDAVQRVFDQFHKARQKRRRNLTIVAALTVALGLAFAWSARPGADRAALPPTTE